MRLPILRLGLLLAAFASLAACQPAYFRVLNAKLPTDRARPFVYDDDHRLSLDVYPARGGSDVAPIVVFFHGGSWRNGRRDYYRFVGEALSAHGVVVVVPDYRKAPDFVFPTFMEDAAAATAWAVHHAGELGGDPARVYVMGHSAGAHIAALLGTDGRYLARWDVRPRQLAGVIGLAGPYDFLPIRDRRLKRIFADEGLWPQSQPVNFVDGDEPPFLLVHGSDDRRVWTRHSKRLALLLQAAGTPVTLRLVEDTGHLGLVNGFRSPHWSPVLAETLNWMAAPAPHASFGATGQPR
jgi:acetyl esterase/lipase